jgi:hypothetical protein
LTCFSIAVNWKSIHASSEAMAELAEAFIMDRLNAIDTERVEQHLLICDGCREAVEAADNFLGLIRLAPVSAREEYLHVE